MKLILVDGNAIVHRAFHALPPLTNKQGVMTNAVYGFFSMLLKVVGDLRPEHLVVTFDRAAPTFRQELFVGYQAQRPKMVDELSNQFKILHQILENAKFKIFEVDGYEADDLIGTLSKQAVDKFEEDVIILSGDRDLLQLVNHRVMEMAPIVGVTKMILFNEERVRDKYGLEPYQIVDYKSLVGDASDNYPGVSGIGPKTASGLINKFGSLEGIYDHLAEINPKLSEKLATDAEQAALAKKLATIALDAPIHYMQDECKTEDIDNKSLLKSFKEQGFQSLINRFNLGKAPEITKIEEKPVEKKVKKDSDQMNLL